MNDIEKKVSDLEEQNHAFLKQIKQLEKKTLGLLWLWFFVPIAGHFIYISLRTKRLTTEPYYSSAIKIKVEMAKNEMEIIKLKKGLSK